MRVLLVDDEEDLVSTLAERLSFRGIDADWVTSGEAALKKIQEIHYDVAVVDVKMPRIGGIELRREMARKCPEMKFIFITGHGSEEDFRAGSRETGAAYYLVKPVDIEELTGKLNEVLKKKGADK